MSNNDTGYLKAKMENVEARVTRIERLFTSAGTGAVGVIVVYVLKQIGLI